MLKLLLLIVGAWLVYSLLKKKYAADRERDDQERPSSPAQEDMVRCVRCAVHLPRSEAILSNGEFFCCDEHRRLQQR